MQCKSVWIIMSDKCIHVNVKNKKLMCVLWFQDAHELGINAVRFSTSSNLLATGGTDRVIKLWDIEAGTSQNWSGKKSSVCLSALAI